MIHNSVHNCQSWGGGGFTIQCMHILPSWDLCSPVISVQSTGLPLPWRKSISRILGYMGQGHHAQVLSIKESYFSDNSSIQSSQRVWAKKKPREKNTPFWEKKTTQFQQKKHFLALYLFLKGYFVYLFYTKYPISMCLKLLTTYSYSLIFQKPPILQNSKHL